MAGSPHSPFFLSVVTPIYRAEAFIDAFHERMGRAARELTGQYELIFVNDGSPDQSLAKLMALQARDPHVVVVDLSRNFGQHKAIYTGLLEARGDLVFVIDDDLEEEPEWLKDFWRVMQDEQAEVVVAVQRARKGRALERWSGALFYFALKQILGLGVVKNIVTARLMSRTYVDMLIAHKEHDFELTIVGLYIGFKRAVITVDKRSRWSSSYTLMKKVRFFVNYVTSATTEPLHWVMPLGLISGITGVTIGAAAVFQYAAYGKAITTGTWLLASVWVLAGLILGALGGVGLYISKIFHEVRGRPPTIVRAVHRHPE